MQNLYWQPGWRFRTFEENAQCHTLCRSLISSGGENGQHGEGARNFTRRFAAGSAEAGSSRNALEIVIIDCSFRTGRIQQFQDGEHQDAQEILNILQSRMPPATQNLWEASFFWEPVFT